MAEKSVWAYLKKGMKPYWGHAQRHECMINKGVADVSYYYEGNGWIELKEVKKAPARATTGVKLGRWHDLAQRHFLIKRHGFLFIRVNYPDRVYMLFTHDNLPPDEKPLWTYPEMLHNAAQVWGNRVDWDELDYFLKAPE
jgi:hypothetical protein